MFLLCVSKSVLLFYNWLKEREAHERTSFEEDCRVKMHLTQSAFLLNGTTGGSDRITNGTILRFGNFSENKG